MKINNLSSEQLALLRQVRGEWDQVCLDTTPVDKVEVWEILGRLYAVAGKPAPKPIIFFDSPIQVLNAAVDSPLESQQASAKNISEIRYEAFLTVLAFIRMRFGDHARHNLCYQVRSQVREQVCKQFGTARSRLYFASFIDTVRSQFVKQVRTKLSHHAASVQANGQAYSRITDQIRDHILDQVFDQVDCRVWDMAHAHFVLKYDGGVITQDLMNIRWGPDPWISWCDSFSRLGFDASRLKPYLDMEKVCGWYILTEHQAIISAKPEHIHLDERGRLHCETGAAIRYPDGFSVYAIHGVRLPEKVVVSPESITIPEIEAEENAEVRRIMIELWNGAGN